MTIQLRLPVSRLLQIAGVLTADGALRACLPVKSLVDNFIVSMDALSSDDGALERDATKADVAAVRSGDGEAYQSLVRRYQQAIALQMRRFSRDPQVVEDLTHDVFVEAYMSLGQFRGTGPWEHWLRKIAVRVGYRYWKEKKKAVRFQSLSDEQWKSFFGGDPKAETASDAAELVDSILKYLAPADRLVLTMIYLEGCDIRETASRCGWTQTGTKLRAFRARKKLAALISERQK